MKIGIMAQVSQSSGGLYQYTIAMLEALSQWDADDEFVIFAPPNSSLPLKEYLSRGCRAVSLTPQSLDHAQDIRPYLAGDGLDLTRPGLNSAARNYFLKQRIELLIYPAPSHLSFDSGIPYVISIADLQHRVQPEFPEVSAGGEWHWREYLFRNSIRYAEVILTDSLSGKEDVLNYYGNYASADRVYALPFLPSFRKEETLNKSSEKRVLQKYKLPPKYLFYPAQFWLHKNHARLVHAIQIVRANHQVEMPLVLVGSNTGGSLHEARELVYQNVMLLAKQLGIADLIHYLGYVPDEEMSTLYTLATALVMPTFFGPTNIPVLEAWAFDCPVLTSDIRGIREQMGEAGLLVDPKDTQAIAEGLLRLWTDPDLQNTLTLAGRKRLEEYGADDFARILYNVINGVRRRWAENRPGQL